MLLKKRGIRNAHLKGVGITDKTKIDYEFFNQQKNQFEMRKNRVY